jgi:hypothetical protein
LSVTHLRLPPDHPSATKLFDLIGLQFVIINQSNVEAALVNAGGDRASFDRHDAAFTLVCKEIESLLDEYRRERYADDDVPVGLTYDARGRPIVDGRTCGLMAH